MFRILVRSFNLFFAFIVALNAFPSFAVAQNKMETADACLAALDAGDNDAALLLSSEILGWGNLFGPALISSAESCLQLATGNYWKYFTTKGGFLMGDEALAEQDLIDGAAARRAAKESDRKILQCEVVLADYEVKLLEAQNDRFEQARSFETFQTTLALCKQIYETDTQSALLNPVCNELFTKVGIPNSQIDFNYEALLAARLNLLNKNEELNGTEVTGAENSVSQLIAECQALVSN